jgi:hypothetical protein
LINDQSGGPATVIASGRNIVRSYRAIHGASTTGPRFLSADPKLGALRDNGGLVPTMALLKGSPAINAAARGGSARAHDARGAGFNRVIGGAMDLGSYEYQPPATTARLGVRVARAGLSRVVQLVAIVRGKARGSNLPGGSVEFFVGNRSAATAPVVGGRAVFEGTMPPPMADFSRAIYLGELQGDASFAPSTARLAGKLTARRPRAY